MVRMAHQIKRAAWLVPDPIEGSGGIRTIFTHIQSLIEHGIECHAYFPQSPDSMPARKLKRLIERFYGENDVIVHPGCAINEEFDLLFATAWYTANNVKYAAQNCPKLYFLQDNEACFHSMGYEYLLTESSYRYGFYSITMGRWLAREISRNYGAATQYIDLCADRKSYYRIRGAEKEKAICFVHQPEKPRRCTRLGLEALGIIKYRVPDVKIYLYGSGDEAVSNAECINLGLISIKDCNHLYNKCKVGLCLSSSNPSRVQDCRWSNCIERTISSISARTLRCLRNKTQNHWRVR
jgi:glycosyltransferase involved in cell wall biosynthesis